MSWQILVGHMPSNSDRRSAAMERKRKEYWDMCNTWFVAEKEGDGQGELGSQGGMGMGMAMGTRPREGEGGVWHQALTRLLYCWAIRHPASGYVQGINDLATPFFLVFLGGYV
ncbi:GTPase-activating protein, partial [Gonapodya sp. JEL0774]